LFRYNISLEVLTEPKPLQQEFKLLCWQFTR